MTLIDWWMATAAMGMLPWSTGWRGLIAGAIIGIGYLYYHRDEEDRDDPPGPDTP